MINEACWHLQRSCHCTSILCFCSPTGYVTHVCVPVARLPAPPNRCELVFYPQYFTIDCMSKSISIQSLWNVSAIRPQVKRSRSLFSCPTPLPPFFFSAWRWRYGRALREVRLYYVPNPFDEAVVATNDGRLEMAAVCLNDLWLLL